MINEAFLNRCLNLCISNQSPINNYPEIYTDIMDVLNNWETSNKLDDDTIRIFKMKFIFLKLFIEKISKGKDKQIVLNSINYSGRFEDVKKYLDSIDVVKLDKKIFDQIIEEIIRAKYIVNVFKNITEMKTLISHYEDNTYIEDIEIIRKDKECISNLYRNLVSSEVKEKRTKDNVFNLNSDGKLNRKIFENIGKSKGTENKVSSGFEVLDMNILGGGFRNGCVYVYAGAAKSGKSSILANLFFNSLSNKFDKKKVMVYITLENTVEQTVARTYCKPLNLTANELEEQCNQNLDAILQRVENLTKSLPNKPHIEPRLSKEITVSNIYSILDSIKMSENLDIGILFVDYLFHLKPSSKNELRIQLGEMIPELSILANHFNIPVVTATQLNREKTRVDSPLKLNENLVGESHHITCHADGLFLMAIDEKDNNKVHFNSGVQRNGRSHVPMTFDVNFTKFAFNKLNIYEEFTKDTSITKKFSGFDMKGVTTF